MILLLNLNLIKCKTTLQWIPIRVRHDKTFAYKKGKNNFGNDYNTANSDGNL